MFECDRVRCIFIYVNNYAVIDFLLIDFCAKIEPELSSVTRYTKENAPTPIDFTR